MRTIIVIVMKPGSSAPLGAQQGAAPAPQQAAAQRVTSRELLGARGELVIKHEGREYRLRITQNGKLILTA